MTISKHDSRLRLAIFDCDGTLVDSQHGILACMREAFRAHGLTPPADEAIRRVIGLSLPDAVRRLAPDPAHPAAALAEAYREAFLEMRCRPDFHEPLFPGIGKALDALEGSGILLGIATGKARRGLLATLERHGLSGRFVTLQTADLNPGKPNPAMLLRAMVETGVEPDRAVLIGDTRFDIEMALKARAGAVGVGWGYHPLEELIAAGAHRAVSRCEELAGTVLDLLSIRAARPVVA